MRGIALAILALAAVYAANAPGRPGRFLFDGLISAAFIIAALGCIIAGV